LSPKLLRTFKIRLGADQARCGAVGGSAGGDRSVIGLADLNLHQWLAELTSSPFRTRTSMTRPETWEASVPLARPRSYRSLHRCLPALAHEPYRS